MTKAIVAAKILENREIVKGVYALELDYSENTLEIRPGQFVNVYLPRQDMLLPRPISICRSVGQSLTLVYAVVGKGTEFLSGILGTGILGTVLFVPKMEQKEPSPKFREPSPKFPILRVSTPLGNGYELPESGTGETAMLIGGGLGIPPMLELAYALKARGQKVIAVLGFREEPFLVDEMVNAGVSVHLAVEKPGYSDLAFPVFTGNVMGLIETKALRADRYFACGPKAMLKAVTKHCISIGKDIQVSLEERMGCGYGACVCCTCKVKAPDSVVTQKRVCREGPVFWGSEVFFDE